MLQLAHKPAMERVDDDDDDDSYRPASWRDTRILPEPLRCFRPIGARRLAAWLAGTAAVVIFAIVVLTRGPRTCSVAPVAEVELVVALARLLGPPGVPHARPVERFNHSLRGFGKRGRFPIAVRQKVQLLVEHIGGVSGCAPGARLELSCPEHAKFSGYEFAALAESIRRATLLSDPRLCDSVFLSIPVMQRRLKNTPGALLQQIVEIERNARTWAKGYGIPVNYTLSAPMWAGPFNVYGTSYFELLLGYMLERPCRAEVEARCGVELDRSRAFSMVRLARGQTATPSAEEKALVASLPRPALVILENFRPRAGQHESDVGAQSVPRLAAMYDRMRRLLPIESPYVHRQGLTKIVNIAVHVRAGPGAKNVPEHAFVPVLDLLADEFERLRTATQRGAPRDAVAKRGAGPGAGSLDVPPCAPHVHVFHEYEDSKCCGHIEAWSQRRALPGMRLFLDIDTDRSSMWHAMWTADLLIAGESKMTHTLGALSSNLTVFLDGSRSNVPTARARRLQWQPCGGGVFRPFRSSCDTPPLPTVGLARNGIDELRTAVDRLCAGATDRQ
jgi:hypothetical protein